MGYEQSRRDDIESITYTLIYLLKGRLPWQNQHGKDEKEKYKALSHIKTSITTDDLCRDLPLGFKIMLNYCKSLEYEDQPDYGRLRDILADIMSEYKYEYDSNYDWCIVSSVITQLENNVSQQVYGTREAYTDL